MSKPVKDMIIRELSARFAGVSSACVVDLTGIDAMATHKLRGGLRAKGIRLQVVKNRMARRAFSGGPLQPVGDVLDGPCALATGGDSIVDVAKTLVQLAKDFPALKLRTAVVDGDKDLVDVNTLAKWKSRKETLAEIAMLLSSPGRRIAGCLAGPGGRIAGCLKAMIEKAEKDVPEAPAAEAPPAAQA